MTPSFASLTSWEHLINLPIWNEELPILRVGDTGVGMTFEMHAGVRENNRQLPDCEGTEIKTKIIGSTSPVTLFTKKPSWPKRAVFHMVERFGYQQHDDRKAFYTGFAVNRFTKSGNGVLTLIADPNKLNIFYFHGEEIFCCAQWDMDVLFTTFSTKCPSLALVDARINGNFTTFTGAKLYVGPNFDGFFSALKSGKITVDFRARTGKDHGVAFRISKKNLHTLFDYSVSKPNSEE